jgi:hypothetical protein
MADSAADAVRSELHFGLWTRVATGAGAARNLTGRDCRGDQSAAKASARPGNGAVRPASWRHLCQRHRSQLLPPSGPERRGVVAPVPWLQTGRSGGGMDRVCRKREPRARADRRAHRFAVVGWQFVVQPEVLGQASARCPACQTSHQVISSPTQSVSFRAGGER